MCIISGSSLICKNKILLKYNNEISIFKIKEDQHIISLKCIIDTDMINYISNYNISELSINEIQKYKNSLEILKENKYKTLTNGPYNFDEPLFNIKINNNEETITVFYLETEDIVYDNAINYIIDKFESPYKIIKKKLTVKNN